jgi:hypothetical protein
MPTLTYTSQVSSSVQGETSEGFAREIDRILADPRGWRKYNYTFVRSTQTPDISFYLETGADADRLCGMGGLSCWLGADAGDRIIIHLDNWLGKSRSQLPLERYHNYVINHEVGHALNLDHTACPQAECARRGMAQCPASVMQQMTRGPAHISPCVESDWPLDPSWLVDTPPLYPQGVGLYAGICIVVCVIFIAIVGLWSLFTVVIPRVCEVISGSPLANSARAYLNRAIIV